jgi:hypothetical protein
MLKLGSLEVRLEIKSSESGTNNDLESSFSDSKKERITYCKEAWIVYIH